VKLYHHHSWKVSTTEARSIQEQLSTKVILASVDLAAINRVLACDISSIRNSEFLHGAVVIYDLSKNAVVDQASVSMPGQFPYVPGYLSFREAPVVLEAMSRLEASFDAILCDGQGLAHPRRFGLACHLGVLLDMPAIGVAKSRLIGEYKEPSLQKGSATALFDGEEQIGVVLRSRTGVKPIFISPGHKCDFPSAVALTSACLGKYRLPEPSRAAHALANRQRVTFSESV